MAKLEFICKNNVHSEAYQHLRRLGSIAATLQSTLHFLKKVESVYYSTNLSMYDLQDQKFYVRYELEKVNGEIRHLDGVLCSGGGITEDYETVKGPWKVDLDDYPDLEPYKEEIINIVNENIDYGCCGGCI